MWWSVRKSGQHEWSWTKWFMWEKAHLILFKWHYLSIECPIQLKDKQVQYKRHPQLSVILRPWSEPPFTAALVGQRIANGSSSLLKYNLCIWNWKWSFKDGHFFLKCLQFSIILLIFVWKYLMIDIHKCHLLTLNTGDTLLAKLRHWVAVPLPTNPTIPAIIGLSLLYD